MISLCFKFKPSSSSDSESESEFFKEIYDSELDSWISIDTSSSSLSYLSSIFIPFASSFSHLSSIFNPFSSSLSNFSSIFNPFAFSLSSSSPLFYHFYSSFFSLSPLFQPRGSRFRVALEQVASPLKILAGRELLFLAGAERHPPISPN